MDWQGQKLSEILMQYLLLAAAAVSFVAGYFLSSFRTMMLLYLAGTAVTFLATAIDWPFYNRHPLQWLPPAPKPSKDSALPLGGKEVEAAVPSKGKAAKKPSKAKR